MPAGFFQKGPEAECRGILYEGHLCLWMIGNVEQLQNVSIH
jgi:hypothetical protein